MRFFDHEKQELCLYLITEVVPFSLLVDYVLTACKKRTFYTMPSSFEYVEKLAALFGDSKASDTQKFELDGTSDVIGTTPALAEEVEM